MSHVVLTAVLSCLFCFLKSIQVYRRYRVDNTHRISAVALTGAGSDTAADVMSSLTLHVRSYRKTCNGLSQTFCLVTSDVEAGKIWNHQESEKESENISALFLHLFFFPPPGGPLPPIRGYDQGCQTVIMSTLHLQPCDETIWNDGSLKTWQENSAFRAFMKQCSPRACSLGRKSFAPDRS